MWLAYISFNNSIRRFHEAMQTLRNRTAGRFRTAEWRKNVATGKAQSRAFSRATLFRHSAVLNLPAPLLDKNDDDRNQILDALNELLMSVSPSSKRRPELVFSRKRK